MNEWFNKFADKASRVVSHAAFFASCVLIVVLWAPSILVVGNIDTWQLIINTLTTIITFLLVALLQNTQQRFEDASNEKENALAMGVAKLLELEGLTDDACRLYDAYKAEEENTEL
jgi:low affinity Fe/Cu permease